METTAHEEGFFEIRELVHLFDFMEEENERDQNNNKHKR